MDEVRKPELAIGDIYEDCSHHPVICVSLDREEDEITGISLIDGSQPRSCSLIHCGIRKLSVEEAWDIKLNGPADIGVKRQISKEAQWWL